MQFSPTASIQDIVAGVVFLAGIVLSLLSRLPKETIKNQADLIQALNGRIKALEDQRSEDRQSLIESSRQMGILTGQVATYRSIPLEEIAKSMQQVAESNQKILDILKTSATTLIHTESDKVMATDKVAAAL